MAEKLFRFGVFEFNPATRQLTRQGHRLRVQDQPLRILEVLLENPERLVTRQELRDKLWPRDIHVDFDLGLTGAVKRLRLALGDSAENPRFVETVPKLGFRFIAPVQVVSSAAATTEDHPFSPHVAVAGGAAAATAKQPSISARPVPSLPVGVWLILGFVALLGVVYVLRPASPPLAVTEVVKLSTSGRAWPQENLLSDGARLYYTEYSISSGFRLRQTLLNGNENSDTNIPGDYLVRALSPDHTTFLAISLSAAQADTPSPVWAIPVIGGVPRRVGSVQTNDFDWSNDGHSLIFARGNQLFVAGADGSGEHLVATVAGRIICPRWSPDSRRIRFTVIGSKDESAIWETQSDGHNLGPLRLNWPGTPMEAFGDWTADGRYFVFTSRRQGISDLWALEEKSDGWHRPRTAPMQLSAGPISYSRPLPSIDGRRIFALGTEPGGELVSVKPGAQFLPYLGGASVEHLDFSRDGAWVTYVTFPEGTLWRVRVDGSGELQLTFGRLRAAHPHWSPDGKRIAFIGRAPGAMPRIYSISADGGNPEPVLSSDVHAQADATWSPDGSQVVFGRDPFGENQDLALYRYTFSSRHLDRMPDTDGLYSPLWSPNGRYIVAQLASRQRQIALIDLQTGSRKTLIDGPAEYPAFSSDSNFVYFSQWTGDKAAIWRVRIRDNYKEKVLDIPFPLVGSFGAWSSLAPDGSVLVLRNRSRTDVYALSVE